MNLDESFFVIRNNTLFKQLTAQECSQLNIMTGFIQPKKNEFIYFNNFSNDRLFFLKKGYVKIGYYNESGNEVIREVLQEGDVFGQIGLERYDNEGEFAQAIKENASICSFLIKDFEAILKQRPDLAISFTKLVGLKFTRLQNRLSDIVYKDVKQRLIDFLIAFANKNNLEGLDKVIIKNYLTHSDIASLIGSTRQTVTTLINILEDEKLIIFERKQITFPSLKALSSYSNFR